MPPVKTFGERIADALVEDGLLNPAQVKELLPQLAPGRAFPRTLKDVDVPMGSGRLRRAALPYTLWMAQRTLDLYRAMTPAEQAKVRDWLSALGGEALLALDIPRLRRAGLRVIPEGSAA